MRERLAYAFCLNFFVAGAEAYSLVSAARLRGVMMLTFYTECANILALLTSLIFCVAAVRSMLLNRPIPHWVRTLRLLSVVMLGIIIYTINKCRSLTISRSTNYYSFYSTNVNMNASICFSSESTCTL